MAQINIPDEKKTITGFEPIKTYLNKNGIFYDRWETTTPLAKNASQDEILGAFSKDLEPFMAKGGYRVADVINVNSDTPGLPAIRKKFLQEHTHSEDEVR